MQIGRERFQKGSYKGRDLSNRVGLFKHRFTFDIRRQCRMRAGKRGFVRSLDFRNAELFPERFWLGRRFQQVGEEEG